MELLTEELVEELNNDLKDVCFKYKFIDRGQFSSAQIVLKNGRGIDSCILNINRDIELFIEDWFFRRNFKVMWNNDGSIFWLTTLRWGVN